MGGGGNSGNLVGSGLGEEPTTLWLESARVGEGGAPLAPAGPCAPIGLEGLVGSDTYFLASGLGALSTFGDSPPTGAPFVAGSGFMSRGTLHRVYKL
jgi:hypothetical protein